MKRRDGGTIHESEADIQVIGLGDIVHTEPGNDKFVFINYVADWILARAGKGKEAATTDGDGEAGVVNLSGGSNIREDVQQAGGDGDVDVTSSAGGDPKARL